MQELVALGYGMSLPCDRFGRTPEMVATRHDQGAALAIVRRSLAAVQVQRLLRGMFGRRKVIEVRAAAAAGSKTAVEGTVEGSVEGYVYGAVEGAGDGSVEGDAQEDGFGNGEGGWEEEEQEEEEEKHEEEEEEAEEGEEEEEGE